MNQSKQLLALAFAGFCVLGAVGCKKKPLDLTITGELKEGDKVREDDNSLYDEHTFSAEKGDVIEIKLTANGNAFDSYILVANPDGTEAGQNDDCVDGAPEQGSCLTFAATQSGTYSIDVNTYDDTGRGEYVLRITSKKP